jgi:AraC family transcriptional regulator
VGEKLSVLDGIELAEADGSRPGLMAVGGAAGEAGVRIAQLAFHDGAHYSSATADHLAFFHLSAPARIDCRVAGEAFVHEARVGAIGICPAGADTRCHGAGPIESLVVSIAPGALALAAAEGDVPGAELIPRHSIEDFELFGIAQTLAAESAGGFPNGALYWNDVAARFIDGFLSRHTSGAASRSCSTLSKTVLVAIRDFVNAKPYETIEVETLARIAGLSSFHFSRAFVRSVGISPHRYVMRLRLRRARELLREGRLSFAEIAVESGFADQSHLCRWVRRVHGVTMRQLAS